MPKCVPALYISYVLCKGHLYLHKIQTNILSLYLIFAYLSIGLNITKKAHVTCKIPNSSFSGRDTAVQPPSPLQRAPAISNGCIHGCPSYLAVGSNTQCNVYSFRVRRFNPNILCDNRTEHYLRLNYTSHPCVNKLVRAVVAYERRSCSV